MTADIHTCSYQCQRPACVLAQRDDLARRAEADAAEIVRLRGEAESMEQMARMQAARADAAEREVTHLRSVAPEKVRALKTAPAAVPAGEAVAYLDIGVGGYLDLGTEKDADELFKLPPGRHMLGIIGTYGVDGYKANPPAADAADYRAAAEAALQNPYEPPERCQQRAAHYLALAARLESPTTPTPEHA